MIVFTLSLTTVKFVQQVSKVVPVFNSINLVIDKIMWHINNLGQVVKRSACSPSTPTIQKFQSQ